MPDSRDFFVEYQEQVTGYFFPCPAYFTGFQGESVLNGMSGTDGNIIEAAPKYRTDNRGDDINSEPAEIPETRQRNRAPAGNTCKQSRTKISSRIKARLS